MKTKLIVMSLLQLSMKEATRIFNNKPVSLGSDKNPGEVVEMGFTPRGINGVKFDVPNINTGTDMYIPARIGKMYVRLSALAIGKNNGGVTYTVSTRVERDQSSIKEVIMTNDFGVSHDAFIQAIKKEL